MDEAETTRVWMYTWNPETQRLSACLIDHVEDPGKSTPNASFYRVGGTD